jgi:ABC-type amino acid transport substrate-binding protein
MSSKATALVAAVTIFGLMMVTCGIATATGTPENKDENILPVIAEWRGDFEALVQRRIIRVLIPYSKTFYFLDKATQRGASYEMVKAFEEQINSELKTRHLKVHALFIPTARDRLIPDLAAGLGDIAVGNLTITPERARVVDFSGSSASMIRDNLSRT